MIDISHLLHRTGSFADNALENGANELIMNSDWDAVKDNASSYLREVYSQSSDDGELIGLGHSSRSTCSIVRSSMVANVEILPERSDAVLLLLERRMIVTVSGPEPTIEFLLVDVSNRQPFQAPNRVCSQHVQNGRRKGSVSSQQPIDNDRLIYSN